MNELGLVKRKQGWGGGDVVGSLSELNQTRVWLGSNKKRVAVLTRVQNIVTINGWKTSKCTNKCMDS
jgi:hypothetical protein